MRRRHRRERAWPPRRAGGIDDERRQPRQLRAHGEGADHEHRPRPRRRAGDERGEPGPSRQHHGRDSGGDDRDDGWRSAMSSRTPALAVKPTTPAQPAAAVSTKIGNGRSRAGRHRRVRRARERLVPVRRRRPSTGPVRAPRRGCSGSPTHQREGGDGVDERPDGVDRRRHGSPGRSRWPARSTMRWPTSAHAAAANRARAISVASHSDGKSRIARQERAAHRRQDQDRDPDAAGSSTDRRPAAAPATRSRRSRRGCRPSRRCARTEARAPATPKRPTLEHEPRHRLVDGDRARGAEEPGEGLAAQQLRQVVEEGGERRPRRRRPASPRRAPGSDAAPSSRPPASRAGAAGRAAARRERAC